MGVNKNKARDGKWKTTPKNRVYIHIKVPFLKTTHFDPPRVVVRVGNHKNFQFLLCTPLTLLIGNLEKIDIIINEMPTIKAFSA